MINSVDRSRESKLVPTALLLLLISASVQLSQSFLCSITRIAQHSPRCGSIPTSAGMPKNNVMCFREKKALNPALYMFFKQEADEQEVDFPTQKQQNRHSQRHRKERENTPTILGKTTDIGAEDNNIMGDLSKMMRTNDNSTNNSDYSRTLTSESSNNLDNVTTEEWPLTQVIGGFAVLIAAMAVPSALQALQLSPADMAQNVEAFLDNPSLVMQNVVETVESMGPLGIFYFGAVYTVAEVLAIPAIPLTASAGYLFGVQEGTAIVLLSASIAAAVSFIIGRTFLRNYVEKALDGYPKFKRIDAAIGREGFKLMLLLRLSPIFPFALSNYLYGVTSVKFWPYFWGTMIGFTPGTIAYVYTGEIGKALTLDSATAEPWYVYVGGLAIFSGFLKIVADVATGIIEDLEEEEES
jgi:uncharacterized membrane protein YdjX (TVP38/TMEM64 family)